MRHILVFRIGQLGDTLVAIDAIRSIRRRNPGTCLILLTNQHPSMQYVSSWDVLKDTKLFDDVVLYDFESRSVASLVKLLCQLRKLDVVKLYYLMPFRTQRQVLRDYFLFRILAGIKNIIGLKAHGFRRRDTSGRLVKLQRESDRLLQIVDEDDAMDPGAISTRVLYPNIAALQAQIISKLGDSVIDDDRPMIAFGPGSKMAAKRWPAERYFELGASLQRKYPECRIVIFGGKEDIELGDSLCSRWAGGGINAAGRLSIAESAFLLSKCSLYLGNDTGTMHLAASVGVPCAAIFSARDNPGIWEPSGNNNIIFRKDVACAGCMLQECDQSGHPCLNLISVAEVSASVSSCFGHLFSGDGRLQGSAGSGKYVRH